MAAPTTGDRVFLRKASGLIKTASNTDVFIYDIGLVSIGLGLGTGSGDDDRVVDARRKERAIGRDPGVEQAGRFEGSLEPGSCYGVDRRTEVAQQP